MKTRFLFFAIIAATALFLSTPAFAQDADGDGYSGAGDCNDADPNNWMSCASCADSDSDGWWAGCDAYVTINGPDCYDSVAATYPGATEACGDYADNQCAGDVGYGIPDEGCDYDTDGLDYPTELGLGTNNFLADTDSDTLSDGLEYLTSMSNPLSSNSDSDAMADGWEWTYRACVNINSADSSGDPDGDTLTNATEFSVLASPCSADTDADTMPDLYEYTNRACLSITTSDASADGDKDWLSNLDEYISATIPCDHDTDDGGEWDGQELLGSPVRDPLIAGDDWPMGEIGTGTGTWDYPLSSFYHDARTQTIYQASEIGRAGTINFLALDVATLPGQTLFNFTIRMKHTPATGYADMIKTTPTQVGALTTWKTIVAGGSHTCAIKNDGTLWCWGNNAMGQLGNGGYVETAIPTQVKDAAGTGYYTDWEKIALDNHTCATRTGGLLYCWGYGLNGQLGDNGSANSPLPKQVTGISGVLSIATGASHSCAVANTDRVYCWGLNNDGQLGLNHTTTTRVPTEVYGSHTLFTTVSAGGPHTCAVKSNKTMWCWGDNAYGEIGNGLSGADVRVPTQTGAAITWSAPTLGMWHSCGTDTGGAMYCWGYNGYGQLGLNNWNSPVTTPTAVYGSGGWTNPAAGQYHTCALKSANNTVYCWGNNTYGQLGNGSSGSYSISPVQVGTDTNGSMVTAGQNHSCAAKTSNTIYCWGYNIFNQIGQTKPAGWDGPTSGWTTVYTNPAGEVINSTGWRIFTFATQFVYNGTSNLMIDINFDNAKYTSSGFVRYTARSNNRSAYARVDSTNGSPLNWINYTPMPNYINYTPNLLLQFVGNADMDGDGMVTSEETACGTNPYSVDSDADGLNDKFECVEHPCGGSIGTNRAHLADADGDGLCDGSVTVGVTCVAGEDADGSGTRNGAESDACDSDTDDDGSNDLADCDDLNINAWNTCATCVDGDGDTYFYTCNTYVGINGPDCNDANFRAWNTCATCLDSDGDTWYGLCNSYTGINGPDCNDANARTWNTCGTCLDSDVDGWFGMCNSYNGIDGPDCSDTNTNAWTTCATCLDSDSDGWYAGCDRYQTVSGPDCDNSVAAIHPGQPSPEEPSLCDGLDNQCPGETGYGSIDEGCSPDTDGDGLRDNTEVSIGTDPGDTDSDDDGLSDGEEYLTRGTDPLGWDTDGDALPDAFEVANLTGHPAGKNLNPVSGTDGVADFDGDGIANADDYWNGGGSMTGGSGGAVSGGGVYVADKVGWPACGYWAESDGDGFVSPGDLAGLSLAVKGKPGYGAVYPATGETQDLDADGFLSPSDRGLLSLMINGQEITTLGSRPAAISRVTPATGVTPSGKVGEAVTITVAVTNTATTAAPGIPVVFSIAASSSGSATVVGGEGADALSTRYDLTTARIEGGRASATLILTAAGTVTVEAKVNQCGADGIGRYCAEVLLAEPVTVTVTP